MNRSFSGKYNPSGGRGLVRDLQGLRFSHWQVIGRNYDCKKDRAMWLCRCDCGSTSSVAGYALTKGRSKSCGCVQPKSMTTHGQSRELLYRIWRGIKCRCLNPNDKNYHHYGGRGITICERWRNSYALFVEDMGQRPSPNHSIDRIDNSKGYCKENCRWASMKQQQRNRRTNRIITYNGKSASLVEWSEIIGLSYACLQSRLKLGWTEERVITTPRLREPRRLRKPENANIEQ